MFDLLNEDEALAQAKSKKRRNSTAATAPIKNQLSREAARRREIRKYLAAEAARQAGEKRKKPEEVFELFNGGELKTKSRLDDSMAVAVVDADELKKRLAEKAARQAEIEKLIAAEETLALEKQRQAEEVERQRLAVTESRTEANLTDAEPIPAGERVKVGERDARVPMIRARMVKLGFLSEDNSFAWMLGHAADKVSNPLDLESILDKELSKAIKAFQKANGIERTGRIDKATVTALNEAAVKQRQAEEAERQRLAAEAAVKQRQAEEAQRLAAEAAVKQRQAEEERKAQEATLALAKQRQAEEAERQRLAAEAAAKQRQAEEERRAQEAALALAKQRQAEEAERQRLAAEAVAKQRQAEEERKAQETALALAKQRQAEEAERQRLAAEAAVKQRQAEEAQRLAAEAAAKQRQAEEERKAQEAALALEKQRQAEEVERQRLAAEAAAKQRQAEEAKRLADNRKVASLDRVSEANEASSKNCNKAKSIIGKYGFEDIETKSCNGKIYHFSATRKGKRFSVKINALTSELTEVKKVLSSTPE